MLKGISPILSPEMLAALCAMGRGDEVVLADVHFPGESTASRRFLRADGVDIPPSCPSSNLTHASMRR